MKPVVVIGAGLAGLYAAHSAASHGADVELIDRSVIGSKHNCGELFSEIYTTAPEECKINKIQKFLIKIDGELIDYDFGLLTPFVMTDKSKHELIIKEKCLALGVNIRERTKRTSADITDKIVIDASGVTNYTGNIGKAVDYGVKPEYCADLPLDSALFVIRPDLMGYSWFFPKVTSINTGDGVYDYRYKCELSKPDKKFILFSGGGVLPMPTIEEYCENVIKGNYFTSGIKVGNALGLINSCLGGGEHLAVLSGMLAGELVAKGKEKHYYKALDEIIGSEMRFGISMYEYMKKQDTDSMKSLLWEFRANAMTKPEILNKVVRKAMAKWITLPDIKENELNNFIGE